MGGEDEQRIGALLDDELGGERAAVGRRLTRVPAADHQLEISIADRVGPGAAIDRAAPLPPAEAWIDAPAHRDLAVDPFDLADQLLPFGGPVSGIERASISRTSPCAVSNVVSSTFVPGR